jgi:hypothetical protein
MEKEEYQQLKDLPVEDLTAQQKSQIETYEAEQKQSES